MDYEEKFTKNFTERLNKISAFYQADQMIEGFKELETLFMNITVAQTMGIPKEFRKESILKLFNAMLVDTLILIKKAEEMEAELLTPENMLIGIDESILLE